MKERVEAGNPGWWAMFAAALMFWFGMMIAGGYMMPVVTFGGLAIVGVLFVIALVAPSGVTYAGDFGFDPDMMSFDSEAPKQVRTKTAVEIREERGRRWS